jgi:hypothetical protein
VSNVLLHCFALSQIPQQQCLQGRIVRALAEPSQHIVPESDELVELLTFHLHREQMFCIVHSSVHLGHTEVVVDQE